MNYTETPFHNRTFSVKSTSFYINFHAKNINSRFITNTRLSGYVGIGFNTLAIFELNLILRPAGGLALPTISLQDNTIYSLQYCKSRGKIVCKTNNDIVYSAPASPNTYLVLSKEAISIAGNVGTMVSSAFVFNNVSKLEMSQICKILKPENWICN
ncbi:MAG: hypothetical protein HC907_36675 [Richelia sp. SM1_7_0]|nr:hypothetical protein [Richelia sp. SM1_7_0]